MSIYNLIMLLLLIEQLKVLLITQKNGCLQIEGTDIL